MKHAFEQGDDSMNKSDLISVLCAEGDLPIRKAEEIVNVLFDSMSTALISGDRIEIRGFGSFCVKGLQRLHRKEPKDRGNKGRRSKETAFFQNGSGSP